MFAIEKLLDSLEELNRASKDVSIEAALVRVSESGECDESLSEMIAAFQDAREEIERTAFRRVQIRDRYLEDLALIQNGLLAAVIRRDKGTTGPLFNSALIEKIRGIADGIVEKSPGDPMPIDRSSFLESTSETIKEIEEWGLAEYSRRSLLLQMNMMSAMINASRTYSDGQIRRRVKQIVADFAVEFATMDKEFESRWETIKRWAKTAFRGAPNMIGLTADVSEIAGLLPKP